MFTSSHRSYDVFVLRKCHQSPVSIVFGGFLRPSYFFPKPKEREKKKESKIPLLPLHYMRSRSTITYRNTSSNASANEVKLNDSGGSNKDGKEDGNEPSFKAVS